MSNIDFPRNWLPFAQAYMGIRNTWWKKQMHVFESYLGPIIIIIIIIDIRAHDVPSLSLSLVFSIYLWLYFSHGSVISILCISIATSSSSLSCDDMEKALSILLRSWFKFCSAAATAFSFKTYYANLNARTKIKIKKKWMIIGREKKADIAHQFKIYSITNLEALFCLYGTTTTMLYT